MQTVLDSFVTLAWDANFYPCFGLGASLVAFRGSLLVRLLHMDTVRSWCNKDLATLLAFFSQTEFQKNWANDAKGIILKPNDAIWFPCCYLPLITAFPCEGEKSIQKAAASFLLLSEEFHPFLLVGAEIWTLFPRVPRIWLGTIQAQCLARQLIHVLRQCLGAFGRLAHILRDGELRS